MLQNIVAMVSSLKKSTPWMQLFILYCLYYKIFSKILSQYYMKHDLGAVSCYLPKVVETIQVLFKICSFSVSLITWRPIKYKYYTPKSQEWGRDKKINNKSHFHSIRRRIRHIVVTIPQQFWNFARHISPELK